MTVRRAVLAATALVASQALAARPAAAQGGPPGSAARLDAVVREYVADTAFSGAVLVARGGDVVYEAAYGEADREWGVANTVDTRFRIASTSKQFAAALALRLMEEGRLDLDAPIVRYLPDYPRPQGERIRVRQLLNHTSGLPDYPHLPGFFEREAPVAHSPTQLLALFDSLPLEFEPGARWSYTNSGYVVLGAIVESITGEPYATALRELLLDPLGLRDTYYDGGDTVVARSARGYYRDAEGWHPAPHIDPSAVFTPGMLRSTVRDLYRWAELLRAGRVFRDPATLELMTTPAADTGLPLGGYGFGVFSGEQRLGGRCLRVIQHGGTIFGFFAGFWRIPSIDAVVVVLDNGMSGRVPELTSRLADVAAGGDGAGPVTPCA